MERGINPIAPQTPIGMLGRVTGFVVKSETTIKPMAPHLKNSLRPDKSHLHHQNGHRDHIPQKPPVLYGVFVLSYALLLLGRV
jgi:hypothetical protein